jgi:hypothetical protein
MLHFAMTTFLSNEKTRRRRFARAIAILFLIYTGFDLASPELCKGDALGDSSGKPVMVTTRRDANEIIEVSNSIEQSTRQDQNQFPEQPANDEDCFCCCTHVIPGTITVSLESADAAAPSRILDHLSILSPTLPSEFHPPRFA